MILVIESSNPEVIHTLSEIARVMQVSFRVEPGSSVITEDTRQRRLDVVRKFKGSLKEYFSGYQPDKHDWYKQ